MAFSLGLGLLSAVPVGGFLVGRSASHGGGGGGRGGGVSLGSLGLLEIHGVLLLVVSGGFCDGVCGFGCVCSQSLVSALFGLGGGRHCGLNGDSVWFGWWTAVWLSGGSELVVRRLRSAEAVPWNMGTDMGEFNMQQNKCDYITSM